MLQMKKQVKHKNDNIIPYDINTYHSYSAMQLTAIIHGRFALWVM